MIDCRFLDVFCKQVSFNSNVKVLSSRQDITSGVLSRFNVSTKLIRLSAIVRMKPKLLVGFDPPRSREGSGGNCRDRGKLL